MFNRFKIKIPLIADVVPQMIYYAYTFKIYSGYLIKSKNPFTLTNFYFENILL